MPFLSGAVAASAPKELEHGLDFRALLSATLLDPSRPDTESQHVPDKTQFYHPSNRNCMGSL